MAPWESVCKERQNATQARGVEQVNKGNEQQLRSEEEGGGTGGRAEIFCEVHAGTGEMYQEERSSREKPPSCVARGGGKVLRMKEWN